MHKHGTNKGSGEYQKMERGKVGQKKKKKNTSVARHDIIGNRVHTVHR